MEKYLKRKLTPMKIKIIFKKNIFLIYLVAFLWGVVENK